MRKMNSTLSDIKTLTRLGITEEESLIYTTLLKHGPQSALDLSNLLKLNRTVIYRITENLVLKGVVTENIEEFGRRFEANRPETLKIKLIEKELNVRSLEDSLPEIIEMLSLISNNNISKSSIKYYRGVEGLKQVTWNETKAKNEFRIYEIGKMGDFVDFDFNQQVIQAFIDNKITDYQLTNHKHIYEYTPLTKFVTDLWKLRYIPKEDLSIDFETIIYNDVYGMYEYKSGEIFCIEIYNENLAETQKEIFDFVWKYSKPMKIINPNGEAIVTD